MHSSVLTRAATALGHMSASGSRGLIHRHSRVVAVARPTDKISCFPPPLDCIRTVSAHADPLTVEPPLRCMGYASFVRYAATPMSFGAVNLVRSACAFGSLNWNSVPSRHIACMITVSLRATATQARL